MHDVNYIDICWISILIFSILLTEFKFVLFLNSEIVWYSVPCCVHLYCQDFDTVCSKIIQGTIFNVTTMFISLPLPTFTSQITMFWMRLQNKSKLWREKEVQYTLIHLEAVLFFCKMFIRILTCRNCLLLWKTNTCMLTIFGRFWT